MSNVQAVYLIIVDPHPQEDIRAFSVVVLNLGVGLTTAQFQKVHQQLQSITLAVVVVWFSLWYKASLFLDGFMIPMIIIRPRMFEVVSF